MNFPSSVTDVQSTLLPVRRESSSSLLIIHYIFIIHTSVFNADYTHKQTHVCATERSPEKLKRQMMDDMKPNVVYLLKKKKRENVSDIYSTAEIFQKSIKSVSQLCHNFSGFLYQGVRPHDECVMEGEV